VFGVFTGFSTFFGRPPFMDLSFLRRAEQRFATGTAAHPDFGMLLAMLRAQALASPAGQAAAQAAAPREVADPVAEIIAAGPGWRAAVALQGGSFSPACARKRAVN
jgi:hypothetical protein